MIKQKQTLKNEYIPSSSSDVIKRKKLLISNFNQEFRFRFFFILVLYIIYVQREYVFLLSFDRAIRDFGLKRCFKKDAI